MNVLSHHETLLYPFGFGLNYTRFAYGDLTLDSDRVAGSDTLRVRCTVSNAGLVEAEEVVQRYLSDLEVTVPVPIHKLVGFERV